VAAVVSVEIELTTAALETEKANSIRRKINK